MKNYLITIVLFALSCNFLHAQLRIANQNFSQKNFENSQKIRYAYDAISSFYVDNTDDNQLIEAAVKAMLEKLDPHSVYFNAEEARRMNEPLEANFDGIGIQFNIITDTLYIVEVISGGPSEKVGLLPGDRIIMVDDTLIAGVNYSNTDIIKLIRGKEGSEVRLKVKRGNLPGLIDFRIIRGKIPIFSIDASYMADKNTGYIRLSRFSISSAKEFSAAINNLKKEGMKNIIVDLQGNGGGYLDIACAISNEFLEEDKLIVYLKGKREREDRKTSHTGIFDKGKLIILVNESSASASEILAGAVQDWDRGVIVGRRTFGKGLVQKGINLPDSSLIRLTTARYYTPSGRFIQKPYEMGNAENYKKDLIDRYNKGELIHEDSIHFPDTLKYNTLVYKRTVYGGGGIMPDVFIPLDSTYFSEYYAKLTNNNIIIRTYMNYLDKNRDELRKKYKKIDIYKKDFKIPEEMLQEMIKMAEVEKIEFNKEQFNRSKELIALQLKAFIARDLFDSGSYYYIINERNDTYQEALRIINDDNRYLSILKGEKSFK